MAGSGVFTIGGRSIPDENKRLAVLGDLALEGIRCRKWSDGDSSKGMRPMCSYRTVADGTLFRYMERHSPTYHIEFVSVEAWRGSRHRRLHPP